MGTAFCCTKDCAIPTINMDSIVEKLKSKQLYATDDQNLESSNNKQLVSLRRKWSFLTKWTRKQLRSELVSFVNDKLNWEYGEIYIDLILSFITVENVKDFPTKKCPWIDQTDNLEEIGNIKCDHTLNIVTLGDPYVGKSCILYRMINDRWDHDGVTNRTILGLDFRILTLYDSDTTTIKVMLWDTSSHEKVRPIHARFGRSSHGIMLVYDITDARTFARLPQWVELIEGNGMQVPANIFLVGSKCDESVTTRQVSFEEGKSFAREHGYQFAEVSAKTGQGVERLLGNFVASIVEKRRDLPVNSKEYFHSDSRVKE